MGVVLRSMSKDKGISVVCGWLGPARAGSSQVTPDSGQVSGQNDASEVLTYIVSTYIRGL